jgi:hypothetical protein
MITTRNKLNGHKNYRAERLIYHDKSSLREDLISILEFDNQVDKYCEEPVIIEYTENYDMHSYCPIFLIFYRNDLEISNSKKPLLCDITTRENLWKKWKEYKPKYKAAMNYADRKGWRFKILTENEIRTDFLSNIKFLNRYKNLENQDDDNNFKLILYTLDNLGMTTPEKVIAAAAKNKLHKAELIFTLWSMISLNFIQCDLTKKLNMQSDIWIDI